MSKAAELKASIFCCTKHAVAGKGMSGVIVARMIRSTSVGSTCARLSAIVAALAAISEVNSFSAAIRRS